MRQDYFRFFSNCLVTRGYTRSVIADLQRQHAAYIPNSLADVIEKLDEGCSIAALFEDYGHGNEETLQEYLDFLEEEEYGFYCDKETFERFPDLDRSFRSPYHVSNIVIESKREDLPALASIVKQAEALGCKDVALVLYESLDTGDFQAIKAAFHNTIIKSVMLISRYSSLVSEDLLKAFSTECERLTSLVFHSAPEKKVIGWHDKILCDVVFTDNVYRNFSFCGGVNPEHFSTNLPKVLEAVNHNSCLHKKISIDIGGNIRNCPAMPQSFGNIKDTTLETALSHPDFKHYWNMSKDHVAGCRDCEFRYICTDCRAYTERTHRDAEGLDNSKPLKCGYDPYTGEWEKWSDNPLKEKAMAYYSL